jgi:hypothetical protein
VKLITVLFSIYIIALSCLPCADAGKAVVNDSKTFQSETHSATDEHTDDACSPFCICNCCHYSDFHKTADAVKKEVILRTFTEMQGTAYTSTLFSTFHNSIWQPPQIS